MEKRININEIEPQAYKAMFSLEALNTRASLPYSLIMLIKIRASQINKCAYCLDMHTKSALGKGETNQRIFLLNGWHEAPTYFTEEERIALAMTEEITNISYGGLSDVTYQKALKVFTENQIAQIIMVIVTINSWNRIALSTKLEIEE
ncbi:carboxymuconolactone decarboxylase family protein [Flavobacteriaceae bacterium XHP0103]|uniref:carboxymuconolactone decarboxylase family protein n=1 Tax=Marixanthotalea marina TaxID=2844359 RepID=UPI002989AA2A|nr:carboxymuconolactone decarboxylase family protein [Marixanthotalea marina]MBU3821597.1 carboxymuconolactone decarboxylase family protein [Marixanthotalea marina]